MACFQTTVYILLFNLDSKLKNDIIPKQGNIYHVRKLNAASKFCNYFSNLSKAIYFRNTLASGWLP